MYVYMAVTAKRNHHRPLVPCTALVRGDTLEWICGDPRNLFVGLLPHAPLDGVKVCLGDLWHRHELINLFVDLSFGFGVRDARMVLGEEFFHQCCAQLLPARMVVSPGDVCGCPRRRPLQPRCRPTERGQEKKGQVVARAHACAVVCADVCACTRTSCCRQSRVRSRSAVVSGWK